jgi:hypothetical protein
MRDPRHSSSCAARVTLAALAALAFAACTTDGLDRLGAGLTSISSRDAGPDRDLGEPLRTDSKISVPPDHSLQASPPPEHTEPPAPPALAIPEDAGSPALGADAGAVEPGPELLPDPSFEAGHAGWLGFGDSRITDVLDAHAGSRAILSTNRTATWQGPIYDILPLVQRAEPYALSAWVRNEVGTHNIMISLKATCGSDTTYSPLSTRAVASQWQQLDASFIVPDCADLKELFVYVEGPPATCNMLVDDVSLRAITLPAADNSSAKPPSASSSSNSDDPGDQDGNSQ